MLDSYSNKSLVDKLGIKEDFKIAVINEPKNYLKLIIEDLSENTVFKKTLEKNLDLIHFFPKNRADLEKSFPELKKCLKSDGILWISWKKNNKTDLSENKVMAIGLENDLVDIKVIAVDKTWSALKFVYRLKDRE